MGTTELHLGESVATRLVGHGLHAPAQLDSECLSALVRLHQSEALSAAITEELLTQLAAAPITRHPLAPLVAGAWKRRDDLRLADALSVELAHHLGVPLITTDTRLHSLRLVGVIR